LDESPKGETAGATAQAEYCMQCNPCALKQCRNELATTPATYTDEDEQHDDKEAGCSWSQSILLKLML
jgi:hypothetical protein